MRYSQVCRSSRCSGALNENSWNGGSKTSNRRRRYWERRLLGIRLINVRLSETARARSAWIYRVSVLVDLTFGFVILLRSATVQSRRSCAGLSSASPSYVFRRPATASEVVKVEVTAAFWKIHNSSELPGRPLGADGLRAVRCGSQRVRVAAHQLTVNTTRRPIADVYLTPCARFIRPWTLYK